MCATMMDHNILIALVSSLLMLILGPLIIDVISVNKRIRRFLSTVTKFLKHDDSIVESVILDDNLHQRNQPVGDVDVPRCSDRHGEAGSRRPVEVRGMAECQGCDMTGVVDELMEDKTASEGELEEAFYVFDRDEDGFICAAELWNVMRRLGFDQGARLEDCTRMIGVFDEDGDGMISFLEFTRMMESAL